MNDALAQLTNQVVFAVLLGCGGTGVAIAIGVVAWVQRHGRPDAQGKRPPPAATVVFTRRARSHDEVDDDQPRV